MWILALLHVLFLQPANTPKKKSPYITLFNQQLFPEKELFLGPFTPWVPLMAQRVTISGWRCRLEWHGCSWGMWGIPLVNTSCSDDHHTLISPCPSSSPLIIIMVGYSLPMLLLLLLLLVSSDRSEQVGLLLFTWGTAWYIIHSDTPQWANRACSDTTVQWLSNVNNLKERGLFFWTPLGPMGTLFNW